MKVGAEVFGRGTFKTGSMVFRLGRWALYGGLDYTCFRIYLPIFGKRIWTPLCMLRKQKNVEGNMGYTATAYNINNAMFKIGRAEREKKEAEEAKEAADKLKKELEE